MAELPTKEELEKLYQEKGHDALVWYAWRNALRILHLLGKISLQQVWQEKTVTNVFAVCWALVLLAQRENAPLQVKRVAVAAASIIGKSYNKTLIYARAKTSEANEATNKVHSDIKLYTDS